MSAVSVQVATADGNEAVIASGLQPGEHIVSAGIHVLAPGQKVTIFQEKEALSLMKSSQDAIKNRADGASSVTGPASSAAK